MQQDHFAPSHWSMTSFSLSSDQTTVCPSASELQSDPSLLLPEERERYDKFFLEAGAKSLYTLLKATDAVCFMYRSGLTQVDLQQIWNLVNPAAQEGLSHAQFCLAMRLICLTQYGYIQPADPTLPARIRAKDPLSVPLPELPPVRISTSLDPTYIGQHGSSGHTNCKSAPSHLLPSHPHQAALASSEDESEFGEFCGANSALCVSTDLLDDEMKENFGSELHGEGTLDTSFIHYVDLSSSTASSLMIPPQLAHSRSVGISDSTVSPTHCRPATSHSMLLSHTTKQPSESPHHLVLGFASTGPALAPSMQDLTHCMAAFDRIIDEEDWIEDYQEAPAAPASVTVKPQSPILLLDLHNSCAPTAAGTGTPSLPPVDPPCLPFPPIPPNFTVRSLSSPHTIDRHGEPQAPATVSSLLPSPIVLPAANSTSVDVTAPLTSVSTYTDPDDPYTHPDGSDWGLPSTKSGQQGYKLTAASSPKYWSPASDVMTGLPTPHLLDQADTASNPFVVYECVMKRAVEPPSWPMHNGACDTKASLHRTPTTSPTQADFLDLSDSAALSTGVSVTPSQPHPLPIEHFTYNFSPKHMSVPSVPTVSPAPASLLGSQSTSLGLSLAQRPLAGHVPHGDAEAEDGSDHEASHFRLTEQQGETSVLHGTQASYLVHGPAADDDPWTAAVLEAPTTTFTVPSSSHTRSLLLTSPPAPAVQVTQDSLASLRVLLIGLLRKEFIRAAAELADHLDAITCLLELPEAWREAKEGGELHEILEIQIRIQEAEGRVRGEDILAAWQEALVHGIPPEAETLRALHARLLAIDAARAKMFADCYLTQQISLVDGDPNYVLRWHRRARRAFVLLKGMSGPLVTYPEVWKRIMVEADVRIRQAAELLQGVAAVPAAQKGRDRVMEFVDCAWEIVRMRRLVACSAADIGMEGIWEDWEGVESFIETSARFNRVTGKEPIPSLWEMRRVVAGCAHSELLTIDLTDVCNICLLPLKAANLLGVHVTQWNGAPYFGCCINMWLNWISEKAPRPSPEHR